MNNNEIENGFKGAVIGSLPVKSDAVEFFNWVNKGYFKGMNGFVPHGWGGYASGYTIEKLYDKYIESLNKQD